MKIILSILFLVVTLNALEKVSLQLMWLDQFQFAGYYIAKEKGFYKDVGLDVEIKSFKYSMDTLEEVLNSKATFGIGRSSLIKEYSNGKKIVLLYSLFQSSPLTLISLKSSNITTVKDFKNKILMLTKDVVENASIHALILSNGIKKEDIIIKEHNFKLSELINKKVDIYTGYISNEPFTLKSKGIEYNSITPKDFGFDFYSDILFTSQKEAQEHPQRVKNFKEASLKGWKYAFTHIKESAKIIYKKYNSQNKTLDALEFEARELKKLAYKDGIKLGEIKKYKLLRIFDIYKVMGLTKKGELNLENIVFDDTKNLFTPQEKEYLKKKKKINICVVPDSLPYSAIKDSKYVGIGSKLLDMTKRYADISYTLVPTKTWMDTFNKGKSKKCDLLPIVTKTPSRKKFFNFTTPYHYEPIVVVTKKSQNYFLDFETILDKKFAVVKGMPFIKHLKNKYPNIKLFIVENTADGLKAIQEKKVDALIDALMSAAYELKKLQNDNLQISGQLDEKIAISFGVRKDDKILFEIFEKLAKTIKPSDIQKLLNDWVYINYTQNVNFKYTKELLLTICIILTFFLYRQHILKKQNQKLQKLKDELLQLNKSLETKVSNAVNEIVKKDAYLVQQSRLAQMGEMLSMIAHQWKQPLGSISTIQISIKMALELEQYNLKEQKGREEFIKFLNRKLEKIDIYTQNLSQIISDFRDFYKPNKQSSLKLLDDTIRKSCSFIDESLDASNIKLNLDLNSKLVVKMHENELMQVILNILSNSKEQLVTKKIKDARIDIRSHDEGNFVIVEIQDNAGGIDEDIINNIFDPYYSTKLEKNGTGLGLYMSKIIIEDYHTGNISASNTKNGAIFKIKIKSYEDVYEK